MARETHDKSIQNRKEAAAKRALKDLDDARAWVMSDARGRLFMYDLIFNRLGLFDVYPALDAGIQRHEGKRAEGQRLAKELQEFNTGNYLAMIAERQRDLSLAAEKEAAAQAESSGGEDA